MGRSVINKTENKQTVILNDSPEGVEGGYFDSEEVWHEFATGNTFINPEVHVTAIRGENVDSAIEIPITPGLIVEDGYINSTMLYLAQYDNEDELNFYAADSEQPNLFYLQSLSEGYVFTFVVSDTVNCSLQSEDVIIVDDISKPCSLTITYTEALPLGG